VSDMLPTEVRPLVCQERGCEMTVWTEQTGDARYQHGKNPEAVLEVSELGRCLVRSATWRAFYDAAGGRCPPALVEDWVERVHAYEDGGVPA
jgi:hypothetical protein